MNGTAPFFDGDGNRPDELLAVVDGEDRETGAERRDVVHARGLLHRAVHVVLTGPDGRVLIQKRSALKDTFPLHWECVGGHLGPGEAYADAARREVREELGVDAADFERVAVIEASPVTGFEFLHVFRATLADVPVPEPTEVIAVEWIEPIMLAREVAEGRREFSPSFVHTLRRIGWLDQVRR